MASEMTSVGLDGYAIAERLGLEAFYDMGGDYGRVYVLDDGRVLKTCPEKDAALALLLLRADSPHPSVPRVDGVIAFEQAVDTSSNGGGVVTYRAYAFVREGFDDPYVRDRDEGEWRRALAMLNKGWFEKDEEQVLDAVAYCRSDPKGIKDVLDGLRHIAAVTGVRVYDIRAANVGESPSGALGMRDLGISDIDDTMLDEVRKLRLWTRQETKWTLCDPSEEPSFRR